MVRVGRNRHIGGGVMAHFAKMQNGQVVEVIVIDNENCGGGDFPQSEPIGQQYIATCGLDGEWLQTSYHANFRGVYAGIGYTYDQQNDVFVAPNNEA